MPWAQPRCADELHDALLISGFIAGHEITIDATVAESEHWHIKRHADFQAVNCELTGLSVDSTYSHIAWERNIKEKFGVDIGFPIIADLSIQVARAYGMIQAGASDTSAVRATFVIDPQGILRAMLYYPMTNGRFVDGILRLVKALRTSDEHGVATPEAWHGTVCGLSGLY